MTLTELTLKDPASFGYTIWRVRKAEESPGVKMKKRRGQEGIALVITLLVMTILLIMGSAFMSISSTETLIAINERNRVQAYHLAEAGAEEAIARLNDPSWTGTGGGQSLTVGNLVGEYSFTVTCVPPAAPTPPCPLATPDQRIITATGCVRNCSAPASAVARVNMLVEKIWVIGGLFVTYYDNIDFTGTTVKRIDPQIVFDWAGGSPDAAIAPEEFSARWAGQVEAQFTETYTFYTTTDDGVRLWVDGQLVIDQWVNQPATEWSGTIALEAGHRYPIQMEFYDAMWDAVAELRWSSPSMVKQLIPQSQLYHLSFKPVSGSWREVFASQ